MEQSDSSALSEPKGVAIPDVLSIKQAAAYLRVGEGTVHEFIAADKIPHFSRGSRVFFRKAELDRWVAEGERLYLRKQTITLERAAEHLEIEPLALFHLAEQRKIKAVRDGNQWRFNVDALDEWFEKKVKREIAKLAKQSETANPQTIASSPRTRTASAPAAAMIGPMSKLEKKQAVMRRRQLAAKEAEHPGRTAETRAGRETTRASSPHARVAAHFGSPSRPMGCSCCSAKGSAAGAHTAGSPHQSAHAISSHPARHAEQTSNAHLYSVGRLTSFDAIREWELFDADEGKDLAVEVREYYIPDFSEWKNHDLYSRASCLGFESFVRVDASDLVFIVC